MHSETFAVSEANMESALDMIVSALQSGLLQHDADAIRAASEVQKVCTCKVVDLNIVMPSLKTVYKVHYANYIRNSNTFLFLYLLSIF